VTSKFIVVVLVCAAVTLAACRREEVVTRPLKLGGPTATQPMR
jgi:hypothetical protein